MSAILLFTIPLVLPFYASGTLFMDPAGNVLRVGPGSERVLVQESVTSGSLPTTPLWDVVVDTTGSATTLYVCAGLAFASQHGGVYVSEVDGVDWDCLSTGFANDFVLSIAVDRTNDQIMLAGTDGDGMYRTTDGGTGWNQVLSSQKTRHIVFDQSDSSIVYSGNEGTGIFKSTDGGLSWFSANAGMSLVNATGIGIDPADESHIYVIWQALNSGGVFVTTDGGNTWTPSPNLPSQRQTGIAVDPVDGNVVYVANSGPWNAGMDDGVYKSTDGGYTWTNGFTFPDTAELEAVAVAPSDPNIVFAGGNKWLQPFGTRIWKSSDAGTTWSLVYDDSAKQFVAVVTIAIDPTDPQVVFAGTRANGSTVTGILKSTDGGASWSEANTGLANLSVLDLSIHPTENSRIMAATAGGIFTSADTGNTWGATDSLGYGRSVAVRADSVLYAGTLSNGVYRSTDFGTTWVDWSSGISSITAINDLAVCPSQPERVVAALSDVGAYAISDTGVAVWVPIGPFGGDVNWVEVVGSNNQMLYAATQSGLFRSTDGGGFWEKCAGGPSGEIAVVRATYGGDTVYVGAAGYYRSTDGGSSWMEIALPTNPYDEVTALSIDPVDPSIVYIGIGSYLSGTYCHVIKSTDGGGTWEFKCGGLPFSSTMEVSCIGINAMNHLKLYATFGSGFFGTSDFYVSLDGGDVWTHPVGVGEDQEMRAIRSALQMSLRPNPFSQSVRVNISGGNHPGGDGQALLVIRDVSGRVVSRLDFGNSSTGSASWDGRSASGEVLPSGIYFFNLTRGDSSITRKAILLR
jgi:photosystem II stability/assembly factor-like uncharacterized protein